MWVLHQVGEEGPDLSLYKARFDSAVGPLSHSSPAEFKAGNFPGTDLWRQRLEDAVSL